MSDVRALPGPGRADERSVLERFHEELASGASLEFRRAGSRSSALTLEAYHPAVVRLLSSVDRQITLAFLRDYPTPQAASKVGEGRMHRFVERHGYTGRVRAEVLVERLRAALVEVSEGSTAGRSYGALALADQLELLDGQLKRFDERTATVFGRHPDSELFSILVNNMAWLLRRFPVFAVAGDGAYRLRPVYVDDVARLWIEVGEASSGTIIEAVGSETFTFEDMVGVMRWRGPRARLVHLPSRVVAVLSRVIRMAVRDVLLTAEELAGLMAELAVTEGPATGRVVFSEWVVDHGDRLGIRYASELGRHFAGSG